MSLVVWLPLDGDLRNNGTLGVAITNNGATINASGKIGQCYQFDNSSSYIDLNHSELYNILNGSTQPFSICFWVYHADTSRAIIFGDYSVTGGKNFNIELTTGHTLRWYWGTPDIGISAMNVDLNIWTHITFTYSGTVLKGYVNGIEKYTNTVTLAAKNRTTGSYYLGRDGRTGTTTLNGKLNDFRIYNHCLSAAEVHEIAQGLVLHYKLDDMKIKTGTNLVTGVTAGGRTTVLTDGRIGVQTTGENADTYFQINLSESITNGTKYFLSCDASGISEGAYWGFPLGAQSNSTLPFKIYNGHNEYSFTANDISWGSNRLFMDDNSRADWANKATFWNFELYKAPVLEVEDSSGYGHNGTVIGSITTNSSTPRYNTSINFPDSACSIGIGNLSTIIPEGIFTFNIWFKKVTDEWSSKSYETILGGPGGFELEAKISSTNSPILKYYSWGGGTTNYTLDEWHMITMVRTTANTQFYLDGELKVTGSAGSIPSGDYFIGAWKTATAQNYRGYLSDARIYCTPLLDKDIKLLYNISMRVDNSQGIHSFEFDESGSRELLQGINITSSFGTHSSTNNPYTKYQNGELYFDTNGSSAGSDYIPISPSGKTYYYDIEISINTGNQFYIGFERYDANKTSRSNNACNYIIATKPTTDITHKHYFGTVDLSTDSTNPCAFIALRILNGWSGTTSGVTGIATIHRMSLREVTILQKLQIGENGITTIDELKEYQTASIYKNGLFEANNFIEN